MAKCTHSWGGQACDRKPFGVLCYAHRDGEGGNTVCVEVSCGRFMNYHDHHGGIIVLVASELDVGDNAALKAELIEQRARFEEEFSAKCCPSPEKAGVVADAMSKYDELVADCDRYVIEFRNGGLFQNLEAESSGPLHTAQRFNTEEDVKTFMRANEWIFSNGGMAIPAVR